MPTTVDRDQVQQLVSPGAQLVDVLPPEEYESQHLPSAINIPLKVLDQQTTAQLERTRPTIVYCYDSQ
jgi:rhodanese-related sulfurtransferase